MSIKQAMWVHGTSVQAQREGYYISRRRVGWGTEIASTDKEWFHFAVPTPVIFGGHDSLIEKAFVLYNTTMTAKIIAAHFYDGKDVFQSFNNISLSGAHDVQLDPSNVFTLKPVHLKWGLGISVWVDFGPSTPDGVPSITFAAAGADFTIPG